MEERPHSSSISEALDASGAQVPGDSSPAGARAAGLQSPPYIQGSVAMHHEEKQSFMGRCPSPPGSFYSPEPALVSKKTIAQTCQIITIDKGKHRQFSCLEVFLVVFETPKAIGDFLAQKNAPSDPASFVQDFDTEAVLEGQLIAVCCAGDEGTHSRHVPVFGVLDLRADLLQRRIDELVQDFTPARTTTTRQCSVWHSIYHAQLEDCGSDAHLTAKLGEDIIKKHLYAWEESPSLYASEGRRMAFRERWSYSTVVQESSSEQAEWIVEPHSDTLLPRISIEWTKAEGMHRLISRVGHHIDITSQPRLVILNPHYPYWRSSGVHFLQLIPPNVTLTRAAVDDHRVSGSLHRSRSILQHLKSLRDPLINAEMDLHNHPSFAQAIVSSMQDFILKMTHAGQSELLSVMKEIAEGTQAVLQSSDVCRYGSAPHVPAKGALDHLIYASFTLFRDSFNSEEMKLFATAMSAATTSDPFASEIPDRVTDWFTVISRLALAITLPLCGKAIQQEERLPGLNAAELEDITSQKGAARLSCPLQKADNSLQSQVDSHPEAIVLYSSVDEEADDSIESSSTICGSSMLHKRRRSQAAPSLRRNKHGRVLGSGSAATSVLDREQGSFVPSRVGKKLKMMLQHIMGRGTNAEKRSHHAEHAKLFRMSVGQEVVNVKRVSSEIVNIFQQISRSKEQKTPEIRARTLSNAVQKTFQMASNGSQDQDLSWAILALAYHATIVVDKIADEAEAAFEASSTSTFPSSTFRKELEDCTGEFSAPLVNLLDKVKYHLDTDLAYDHAVRAGNYSKQIVMGRGLVKAVLEGHSRKPLPGTFAGDQQSATPTEVASLSVIESSSVGRSSQVRSGVPTVYLAFIGVGTSKAKADKNSARLRECVFDVLFQTYFAPLVDLFTSQNLIGDIDEIKAERTLWGTLRRYLKFRLDFIEQLVENGDCGTSIFAANTCSQLVFAPQCYLPLTEDAIKSRPNTAYTFPPLLTSKQGEITVPASEAVSSQGWEALYGSLRAAKDEIMTLAREKDPSRSILGAN